MEQEINEIIKKNLPASVGDILRQRLELLARLEKDNANHVNSINEQNDEILELRGQVKDRIDLEAERFKVNALRDSVFEMRRDLDNKMLKFELKVERSKSEFVERICMGIVRNPIYRKHIVDKGNIDGYYNDENKYIPPHATFKDYKEEQIEE